MPELFPNPLQNPEFYNGEEEPLSTDQVRLVRNPDTALQEGVEAVDQGRVPVPAFDTNFEDIERVQIPTEGREEAIRDFVEAKIGQARQQAETARQLDDRATAQLAGNTFGPSVFQALTGASFNTGQQQAEARQRAAQEEALRATGQAQAAEGVLQAQGEQQISQLEAETSLQEQQVNREIEQINQERDLAQLESLSSRVNLLGDLVQESRAGDTTLPKLRERYDEVKRDYLELGTPQDFQDKQATLQSQIEDLNKQRKQVREDPTILGEEKLQQIRSINDRIGDLRMRMQTARQQQRLSRHLRSQVRTIEGQLQRKLGIDTSERTAPQPSKDADEFVRDLLGGGQGEQSVFDAMGLGGRGATGGGIVGYDPSQKSREDQPTEEPVPQEPTEDVPQPEEGGVDEESVVSDLERQLEEQRSREEPSERERVQNVQRGIKTIQNEIGQLEEFLDDNPDAPFNIIEQVQNRISRRERRIQQMRTSIPDEPGSGFTVPEGAGGRSY